MLTSKTLFLVSDVHHSGSCPSNEDLSLDVLGNAELGQSTCVSLGPNLKALAMQVETQVSICPLVDLFSQVPWPEQQILFHFVVTQVKVVVVSVCVLNLDDLAGFNIVKRDILHLHRQCKRQLLLVTVAP